jgi:hypothetical protein
VTAGQLMILAFFYFNKICVLIILSIKKSSFIIRNVSAKPVAVGLSGEIHQSWQSGSFKLITLLNIILLVLIYQCPKNKTCFVSFSLKEQEQNK